MSRSRYNYYRNCSKSQNQRNFQSYIPEERDRRASYYSKSTERRDPRDISANKVTIDGRLDKSVQKRNQRPSYLNQVEKEQPAKNKWEQRRGSSNIKYSREYPNQRTQRSNSRSRSISVTKQNFLTISQESKTVKGKYKPEPE